MLPNANVLMKPAASTVAALFGACIMSSVSVLKTASFHVGKAVKVPPLAAFCAQYV